MNKRPIIVFDLDGTLVDSAPDLAATMNELLRRRGRDRLALPQVRSMIGRGAKVLMQLGMTATGTPASPSELDEMFDEFIAYYGQNIANDSRFYPGVPEALDRLDARDFTLALCTNKPESLARGLVQALGIEDRFASLLGGDSLAVRKPDPEHLLKTIALAGGDGAPALMVGDSVTDVSTARAANLPVIGVSFGYTETPMVELAPDQVIDHFDELDGAISEVFGLSSA